MVFTFIASFDAFWIFLFFLGIKSNKDQFGRRKYKMIEKKIIREEYKENQINI